MDPAEMDEDDPTSVEILGGVLPLLEDELACLCCDGPADSELNALSELVLESEEHPVAEVLQDLLEVPSAVPAGARLCRPCLAKVLRFHQLREAIAALRAEVRDTFLAAAALRAERCAKVENESVSLEDLDTPFPPPPLPSPPPPPVPSLPPAPPPVSRSEDPVSRISRVKKEDSGGGGDCGGDGDVGGDGDTKPVINISIQVLPPTPQSEPQLQLPRPPGAPRPPLTCSEPDCDRSFPTRGLLEDHVLRHHAPPGLPCPECTHVAATDQQLEQHVAAAHLTGPARYRCDECERRFHLTADLEEHRKQEHNAHRLIRCRHCRSSFRSRNAYLEHLSRHTGRNMLQCPACTKTVRSRMCLVKHMQIHRKHGEVHACDQCEQKFATIGRLRTHQKERHDIERPWRCEVPGCSKAFKSSAALAVHSRNHTGERPHGCDQCGRRFSTNHRLTNHQRIHSGERPYQCAECGRQFRYRSNLLQHAAQAHQTDRPDRPHQCADCDRAFAKPRQLAIHRTHFHRSSETPATSTTTTISATSTTAAAATANGLSTAAVSAPSAAAVGRPVPSKHLYRCHTCQRTFLRLDNLRTHMFIHSGKKPFECAVCHVGFVRRTQLLAHLQALGHGRGLADGVINEAVFMMDVVSGDDDQEGRTVRLVSARRTEMAKLNTPDRPPMRRVFVRTITPNAPPADASKPTPHEQQTPFKATSPSRGMDSPRPLTAHSDHEIIFRDSSDAYLDSPGIARLDDEQIIFKPPDSPKMDAVDSHKMVTMESSGAACDQNGQQ